MKLTRIFANLLTPLLFLLAGCQADRVLPQPLLTATAKSATNNTIGAAGLGDPLYPGLGNAGYDALHYTIDLTVAMENYAVTGTATISAQANQALSSFNFDFQGLQIQKITVNATPATFQRAASELTITPATALRNGEQFTTTIAYSGVPTAIADPGVPFEKIGWLIYQPASLS